MARSKKSNSATSASAEETGGCLLVPTAPFLALVGSEISKLDLISTTTSTKVPKKKAKQTITKAAKKEKPKPAANTIDNGLKPPECISTIPIEIEVSVPTVVSHPASSKAPKQKKKKTKRAIDHTRDESVLKNAENTDDGLLAITASISAMSIMGSKDPNPSLVVPISFDQATPPVESTKTPSQRRRERQKDRIREMQKANLERDAEGEFSRYSNGGNVSSWRRLCEDVGIEERLTSISQCKKALNNVWVNIYDLHDALIAGTCPPHNFQSEAALSKYTKNSGRAYPKGDAKAQGAIRGLLSHVK